MLRFVRFSDTLGFDAEGAKVEAPFWYPTYIEIGLASSVPTFRPRPGIRLTAPVPNQPTRTRRAAGDRQRCATVHGQVAIGDVDRRDGKLAESGIAKGEVAGTHSLGSRVPDVEVIETQRSGVRTEIDRGGRASQADTEGREIKRNIGIRCRVGGEGGSPILVSHIHRDRIGHCPHVQTRAASEV